jgi:hypothetical protein
MPSTVITGIFAGDGSATGEFLYVEKLPTKATTERSDGPRPVNIANAEET